MVHDDGTGPALYAGGHLNPTGGRPSGRVARFDGASWSAVGGDLGSRVAALAVYDDGGGEALYAAGLSAFTPGAAESRVVRWDGESWSAVDGLGGGATAMAVYDDGSGAALYAAGSIFTAGGMPASQIAKWDGSGWSPLSDPMGLAAGSAIRALAVYDDGSGEALYVAGSIGEAGGQQVANVARWDGRSWAALKGPGGGVGTSGTVEALAVYDDGGGEALYAAGLFSEAGGVTVNNVAKWDGTAWSALSDASGTGTRFPPQALAVYDDGGGESLYAAGSAWGQFGPISKWNGTRWSALPAPNHLVNRLAVFDDGSGAALYAAGWFTAAGAVPSSSIARWSCVPRLPVHGGRFEVAARWTDFEGRRGAGEPVALSDQSGYFWFFGEDNVELVVKVLNACVSPFDRYWVFAVGLTNVGVTLTVTDTFTGARARYDNSLGRAFAPIVDTDALAVCEVADPDPGAAGPGPPVDEPVLHLHGGRFDVAVTWMNFIGATGHGAAVPWTDDSGYFWFFSQENVELVVKVLDACADPYHRYWVFLAGLTNLEIRVTVTDTATGTVRRYYNHLSEDFQPILDTSAFATCEAGP